MRTSFTTAALAAVLMFGTSGLALAQTSAGSAQQPTGAHSSPGMMQPSMGSPMSGVQSRTPPMHSRTPGAAMGSAAPTGAHDPATMGQTSDSRGGTMHGSMAMDEDDVRSLLRDQGYNDIQSVSRDGNNFRVGVTRNGRPTSIVVDAYTGTIRNQSAGR